MSIEPTLGRLDPDEPLSNAEMALHERELRVRERELALREASLEDNRFEKGKGWGRAPLTLAIVGATLALISNVAMEGYRAYQTCHADARKGFTSAVSDYTAQLSRARQALTFLLYGRRSTRRKPSQKQISRSMKGTSSPFARPF